MVITIIIPSFILNHSGSLGPFRDSLQHLRGDIRHPIRGHAIDVQMIPQQDFRLPPQLISSENPLWKRDWVFRTEHQPDSGNPKLHWFPFRLDSRLLCCIMTTWYSMNLKVTIQNIHVNIVLTGMFQINTPSWGTIMERRSHRSYNTIPATVVRGISEFYDMISASSFF